MAELLLQVLGSLTFCCNCVVQQLFWSLVILIVSRQLLASKGKAIVSSQRCQIFLSPVAAFFEESQLGDAKERGYAVGMLCSRLGSAFVNSLSVVLAHRTGAENSVRTTLLSFHGIWQYRAWFCPGQTNFILRLLLSSSLRNCEKLSIDCCFRLCVGLSCFIHFVLLWLLIKDNTCVNEMSSKHLPHYGFCYIRSYDWSQCFSFRRGRLPGPKM